MQSKMPVWIGVQRSTPMRKAACVDQISLHQNQSEVDEASRRSPGPFVKSRCTLAKGLAWESEKGLRLAGVSVSLLASCSTMEAAART